MFKDLFTANIWGRYETNVTHGAQRSLLGSYGLPNTGYSLSHLIQGFTHLDLSGGSAGSV